MVFQSLVRLSLTARRILVTTSLIGLGIVSIVKLSSAIAGVGGMCDIRQDMKNGSPIRLNGWTGPKDV